MFSSSSSFLVEFEVEFEFKVEFKDTPDMPNVFLSV